MQVIFIKGNSVVCYCFGAFAPNRYYFDVFYTYQGGTSVKDPYLVLTPDKAALTATAAPQELTTVNDIVWELAQRGILTDKDLWLKKLEEDSNAYWLARKTVMYLQNKGI